MRARTIEQRVREKQNRLNSLKKRAAEFTPEQVADFVHRFSVLREPVRDIAKSQRCENQLISFVLIGQGLDPGQFTQNGAYVGPDELKERIKEVQSRWSAEEEYQHRAIKNPPAMANVTERLIGPFFNTYRAEAS